MKRISSTILFLLLIGFQLDAEPLAKHFIIIGCDGMSPNGVLKAHSPVMRDMMASGAYTLHARGVLPTVSSPNWASMIMGAGPERHGITSNEWETNKFEIPPVAKGPGGFFPTIFSVVREKMPGAVIGCFHDWNGFGRLVEPGVCTKLEDSDGPTNAMEHAISYLKETKPAFLFVHLDHVDHAGHHTGHGTQDYFDSVDVADKLIGAMRTAIKESGIEDSTLLLITADHGGKGKGHGGATLEELEIPWILTGPGVRKGYELTKPVNTIDTAATVAYALGVDAPSCWVGKPVKKAFQKP